MGRSLRGVVAAIATPIDGHFEPDVERFVHLARYLLDNGCDGLNVLGTTGEATSFSRAQRQHVMSAVASGADASRMMVGTGAAALDDAIALTRHAADMGFAGALILPPFYYKGIGDEGLLAYFRAIADATTDSRMPIYLYHYPALSGVPFTPELVGKLTRRLSGRIVGLKDSSGDMVYAQGIADAHPELDIFPSTEAILPAARAGQFAGCISATANLNSELCARAFHKGDPVAHDKAVAIRKLFDGKPLVAGVKAAVAHLMRDDAFAIPMPPLSVWSIDERQALGRDLDVLRADG